MPVTAGKEEIKNAELDDLQSKLVDGDISGQNSQREGQGPFGGRNVEIPSRDEASPLPVFSP